MLYDAHNRLVKFKFQLFPPALFDIQLNSSNIHLYSDLQVHNIMSWYKLKLTKPILPPLNFPFTLTTKPSSVTAPPPVQAPKTKCPAASCLARDMIVDPVCVVKLYNRTASSAGFQNPCFATCEGGAAAGDLYYKV
jgi:hypothetical protein